MSFRETTERQELRAAAARLGARYGHPHFVEEARKGGRLDELWAEAGRYGYLGVNIPAEYGGGGGGIGDLAAVCEEFAAAGCPLLLMVVSPAICGTVISRYGTAAQRSQWLPRFADGSVKMAFGITEPEAGSNSHRLSTVGRRDGDGWLLSGQKCFISGVDGADAVLVVGRTADARTGKLRPALYIVPTDAPGFRYSPIEMDIVTPERQFMLYLDDVRLPADALVGAADAGLAQLFAGLNPERILVAAFTLGIARYALGRAVEYARGRQVWDAPIGAHQGVAHPLAQAHINVELARLMTQKAAWLYDDGDDEAAGEAANMAKFAAAEATVAALDQAIQVHGGTGLTADCGLGSLLGLVRVAKVAPVSREMVLNFVAQNTLGLPRSY